MKTQLTENLDQYLQSYLNIYLDDSRKWTIEEIVQEVHQWGIKRGKIIKEDEIKDILNIK
jgi:hypothetical protein